MNKIIIFIGLCCLVTLNSCNNWLDVKPYDEISEDELLNSAEGYKKLLNGVYVELNDDNLYGSALTCEMVEVMGGAYEIGTDANTWGKYIDLYNHEYTSEVSRDRFSATWNKAYALILNCNKIINNIDAKQSLFTNGEYNIIKGEAIALRAMLHFDMLRIFGPVYTHGKGNASIPYYTTSDAIRPAPILSAEEIMQKIISDLKNAKILLANDPIITQGTLMSGDLNGNNFLRYRALRLNYYAVTGLLARASLYANDKETAFNNAQEVIKAANNGIFPFINRNEVIGSANDPDRIFSSEILFALTNTGRSSLFKNYFAPTRLPDFVFKMEDNLLNSVIYGGSTTTGGSLDDYRYRADWSTVGNVKYFYKYADMVETGRIENTMIPMLRLGEMYLIAAESQSDDLTKGVSYVNVLRKNRGVSNLSTLTQDLLRNEYIRELYGEGQLFFYYKRTFTKILRSVTNSKNVQPSDKIFIVPLPDSETENR